MKKKSIFYNGLDRVNNNDEYYTFDNIITCCCECNYMKNHHSINTFKSIITNIYNHRVQLEKTLPLDISTLNQDLIEQNKQNLLNQSENQITLPQTEQIDVAS